MLPESGFRQLTEFRIFNNRLAGALPDGGMRAMQAVTYFSTSKNSFAGTLPESGFRKVTEFRINFNRFAGMLSDRGMRAIA
eukprot:3614220-Amphidinium_carterae.1